MADIKKAADWIFRRVQVPVRALNTSHVIEKLLRTLGAGAKVFEIGSGKRRHGPGVINLDCQPLSDAAGNTGEAKA